MNIRRLLFLLLTTVVLPYVASAQWTTSFNGSPAKRAVLQFSAPSATNVWAVVTDANYEQYIKEVITTSNGGNSWTVVPINITGTYQVNAISAIDGTHAWAVLESDTSGGIIAYTGDGGANWNKQDSASFQNSPVWIHFWNDTSGLAIGNPVNGRFEIFTTTTGGLDWTKVSSMDIPVSQDDEYALTNSFSVKGDTVLFAGATYGKIYTSYDKGKTWLYLPFPLNNIKKVIVMDSARLIAGTPGLMGQRWDMYISYDWAQHWTALNGQGSAYLDDICRVPGTDSVLVSTGIGLSYSNNNGRTWTNFNGPSTNPSPYYNTVLFADLTHGWAGGVNPSDGVGGISKYNGPAMSVNDLNSNEFTVEIYPNPCSEVFHLQINGDKIQDLTYHVFDMTGRIILTGNINKQVLPFTTDINVSSLSPGFYMLQLRSQANAIQKELIVR